MIRPAIHLVSLTGRWQHFVADASALAPFPMSLTSSEYVVALPRRGGKNAPCCPLRHQPPTNGRSGQIMKRFKRNRIQRAFDKGYQLGLAGRSRENCPFLTGLARIRWLDGWREGRSDWREGLSDAITCYKLSGF